MKTTSTTSAGVVCKGVSIVLFLIDLCGGFVIAKNSREFNWVLFLGIVIGSFLFCLGLYALGEIINQLQISNENTERIANELAKTGAGAAGGV